MEPLTIRIWVEAELVLRQCLALEDMPNNVALHTGITDQAEADGKLWLLEIYDPNEPEGRQYLRFGTDPNGMVAPQPGFTNHPWLQEAQ